MSKDFQKLMAETYDRGNFLDDRELDFWLEYSRKANGPVLELGCGTGRVLIPLLERKVDVSGLDNSDEMIRICISKCHKKKLPTPEIHAMSMTNFRIEREFRLIILPSGSLSLFTMDSEIEGLFESVYSHLTDGGFFIFEAMLLPDEKNQWQSDDKWMGNWFEEPDDVLITQRKMTKYDKNTHCWKTPVIYDKYKNGQLIESELNVRSGRLFEVDEIKELLAETGFKDIVATDLLSDDPLSDSSSDATFVCTR